jgi:uncharacterized protein with HEPN domain
VKDERVYLLHMLECAERIFEFTRGGRDEFFADRKTQDAVVRNFEILGEAAKRVPEEARERASDIPWRQISGFRDVLIHQYEGIDLEQVWERVAQDLPSLHRALLGLLETSQE